MEQQPNKDYIIYSFQAQLSEANMRVAEREAVITEQQRNIIELEKKMEELREEVGNKEKAPAKK